MTELKAEMAANRRPLLEVSDDYVGSVINLRWLGSPLASFRLIGVVNRTDRRDFTALTPSPSCGEVRLVYRLAYHFQRGATTYASRLPVNINMLLDVPSEPGGECPDLVRIWTSAAALPNPGDMAGWRQVRSGGFRSGRSKSTRRWCACPPVWKPSSAGRPSI